MDFELALESYRDRRRWWIAYSGGVDSSVLLHLLAHLRDSEPDIPPLTAIHINHQLNPRAAAWAGHCRAVCAQLGIELIVEAVDVDRTGNIGLEAAARRARYAAFERHIRAGELLLQGHHADDQVETLLLRLLRGSGVAGLAAIPSQRVLGQGELLRPLLQWSRRDIVDYAQRHQLHWIEDDSNENAAFDRNFLRLNVLPQIAQRWPAYRQTLARVSEQAREAGDLLDVLGAEDHARARRPGGELSTAACLALEPQRRRNLLRYWLRQSRLPTPSREQLLQVESMLSARRDSEPCVQWPGAEVRRFGEGLYAMAPLPPLPADIDCVMPAGSDVFIPGLGHLRGEWISGHGLRSDRQYRIRNRRGGERCRPATRAHSQTLKKLLQEYAVPPWLRDRMPLIYCGDELAAVGHLWVCAGFVAEDGQPGWALHWSLD